MTEKRKLRRLAVDLVDWSVANGRQFPWRNPSAKDYEKIVVEVLLQRTTATAVCRFYRQFFDRFPGWVELSVAEVDDLEEFLKPLGLWRRRAAALTGLARYMIESGGIFPSDPALHAKIPAVGQYVSNAVLMFQHGQARPLLDSNMARVIERFVRPRRLADIRYDPWLQAAATYLVQREDPATVSWAVLDFAALVCKPRNPTCPSCPVRTRCAYAKSVGYRKV